MRNQFRAFYPLSEAEREKAWSEGLLIFDTSSLLNLYRYPIPARDRLLAVLDLLRDRLWLPHQSALEYHRNQPAVRLDQATRFRKVRDEIGALKAEFRSRIDKLQLRKRHALIDAEPLFTEIASAIDKFQDELNQLEREQNERYQEGSLQSKIEELFDGRVGSAPTQNFLDKVCKEGKERYEHRMPPGYQDQKKEDSAKEAAVFMFGGLVFRRQFGDLIIWKQILEKVAADKIKWFIFVTDDAKEDWWQIVGGQRTGPRPELVEEAIRVGGVEGFILETSEYFTEKASRMLGMEVSEEVIQQISTASRPDSPPLEEEAGFLEKIAAAEDGLEEMNQVSEGLALELRRVQGFMEESTRKLRLATDARMKTKVTNEAASQINAAAINFEAKVDAFEVSLKKIEPGVEAVMNRIAQLKAEGAEIPTVRDSLKALFDTVLQTVRVAEDYDRILADIPDATAALRGAIRKLREGVRHYIRAAGRVQRWSDQLE